MVVQFNHPVETYIEPFAGGAGAALRLLYSGKVNRIVLNDFDEFVYKFWMAALYDTERLIKKIKDTLVDIEEWKRQRKVLINSQRKIPRSDLDIGFATFYLNRCNRSGILSAGPIGGYNQRGKWKIDCRFNKVISWKRNQNRYVETT
jgi:DNA adenine methylase